MFTKSRLSLSRSESNINHTFVKRGSKSVAIAAKFAAWVLRWDRKPWSKQLNATTDCAWHRAAQSSEDGLFSDRWFDQSTEPAPSHGRAHVSMPVSHHSQPSQPWASVACPEVAHQRDDQPTESGRRNGLAQPRRKALFAPQTASGHQRRIAPVDDYEAQAP